MRTCLFIGVCSLLIVYPTIGAAERIDDLTILQDGVFIESPVSATDSYVKLPVNSLKRGMNDGYVFCSASDDCYPFDLTTHIPGSSIGGYLYPYDAVMKPDGSEIWTADASVEGVVVLDRVTDTVIQTIPIGGYTTGMAFSGDGSFALAADRDSDLIKKINTTTYAVEDSITDVTGESFGPGFVSYCPGNDRFYVSQWYDNRLFEISSDGTEILQETTVGSDLWQLVCSHDGTMLYILDRGNDVVIYFDIATFSQSTTVSVGDDPWGIDITPDDSKLVVGCEDSHELYICDTVTPGSTPIQLYVNNDPRDVDISTDGTLAYIPAGSDQDHVLILDIASMALVDSIAPSGAGTTNTVSVAPQMGPYQSSFPLTCELIAGDLQLSWEAVDDATAYWVYGASNIPYFIPGFSPGYDFRLEQLNSAITTWASSNGVGDPDNNWTYLVIAVDGSETELARSNRVGEHDFEGDIP